MSWNYRIMRRQYKKGEFSFGFHEVYYNSKNKIKAWTTDTMAPHGDSLKELINDISMMTQAIGKARIILDYKTGKPIKD